MDYERYIGKMLDNRYELLEVIGVGGMAVVYKARCHRLNRLVAIKILKDEYSKDQEFRRRFHAESQAVAMLSHPNIVSVFDVNFTDSMEYIVMELIDGITLKQYMQSKKILSWREALHFTTQIVKALSHAHSRGIIHRDIKPHNIMLLRDGTVKVADFGIARVTAKQNTLTQEALGSVHYISPEQARGSHIDARSDLYSVGVVMYEMTTGRLPFEGDTPVSIAIQHINSMPLAPREINPDIPEGFEQIILHAMASNMNQRYSSANDMLHDLEEFRKNPMVMFPYAYTQQPGSEASVTADNNNLDNTEIFHDNRLKNEYKRSQEQIQTKKPEPVVVEKTEKKKNSEEKTKMKPAVIVAICAAAAILIGLLIAVVSMLGGMGGSGNDIVMPDIQHKNIDAVRLAFENSETYKSLKVEENSRVANEEYPEGTILEQYPPAGRTIKENATVTVTVSSGTAKFELQSLTNIEYHEAEQILRDLGLNVAPIQFQASDEIPENFVISTSPSYGSQVLPGDTITMYVSQGEEVKKTKVPDLLSHTENEVARLLQEANLTVGLATQVNSEEPAGTVVWQSISSGTEVDEKTVIDYRVSKGPEESPSPSPSPTETPTEAPTPTPTPTPTATPEPTPSAQVITKTFDLPSGEGDLLVLVTLGNEVIHDKTHQLSEGSFEITFSVSEPTKLKVYYNGEMQYELDVP